MASNDSPNQSTVLASFTRAFIDGTLAPKPRRELLARVLGRPDWEVAGAPSARLAIAETMTLWESAASIAGPDVGLHFAERIDVADLGVVGYLGRACATLGEAYDRLGAFHRVFKDSSFSLIVKSKSEITIHEGPLAGDPPWPRPLADAVVASWLRFSREWTGVPIVANRVSFQHSPPDNQDEYARIFECRPVFGATTNALVVSREVESIPLETREPGILPFLESEAARQRGELRTELLRGRVEHAIAKGLGRGSFTLEDIARVLGVGARTLQRRLADDGLTFQQVLEEVRRREAERLSETGRLTTTEIAFLLGFSDPSSFFRALRRWRRAESDTASRVAGTSSDS